MSRRSSMWGEIVGGVLPQLPTPPHHVQHIFMPKNTKVAGRFISREDLRSVKLSGEAGSADSEAAEAYPPELARIIQEGGYKPALTDEDLLDLEQEDSPEDVKDSIEEAIGFSEFSRNGALRTFLEDVKKKIIYLKVLDPNFERSNSVFGAFCDNLNKHYNL
ncbi:hypothetical protein DMENIID0001_076920 [Sergentomyia squamirostris]